MRLLGIIASSRAQDAFEYLVAGGAWSPYAHVYLWDNGFGTKYANPATIPTGSVRSIKFTSTGDAIAFAHANTPYVSVYAWTTDGFGTRFSNPATIPDAEGRGIDFKPGNDAIMVAASNNFPHAFAYPWSGSGFGTKYANPAAPGPANSAHSAQWTSSGGHVVLGVGGQGQIYLTSWSNGWGTKLSDPSGVGALGTGQMARWKPVTTDAVALSHDGEPYISAWSWNGSSTGSKFSNPSTLPAGNASGMNWNRLGTYIAAAHNSSPGVSVYPWSSGFGTKVSNPATVPQGNGMQVDWNEDNTAIAVASTDSPYIQAYPWTGSAFGTKYANPAAMPEAVARSALFFTQPS